MIACMRMAVLYGCCCLLDLHELSTPLFVKKPHSNFLRLRAHSKIFASAARKKKAKKNSPAFGRHPHPISIMHARSGPPVGDQGARVCVLRDVRVVSMCMSVRVGACLVAHARGREPVLVRVHT